MINGTIGPAVARRRRASSIAAFSSNAGPTIRSPWKPRKRRARPRTDPTWQRRIGQWFRAHFPNVQLILTTDSLLVYHAAEEGSVWRLPSSGSDEGGRFLGGPERARLIYGDISEAYT